MSSADFSSGRSSPPDRISPTHGPAGAFTGRPAAATEPPLPFPAPARPAPAAPGAGRPARATAALPALTSLRGIAALWVVLFHYAYQYFPNLRVDSYSHVFAKGYMAVDFFFLLSGFVMTHGYHRSFDGRVGEAAYWDFMKARVARVYPAHLSVLGLFLVTDLVFRVMHFAASGRFQPLPVHGARSFVALLANLFMVQGLDAKQWSWNYPAWSISLEFIAYLVFPFALAGASRRALRGARPWLLAALLAALLGLFAVIAKGDFNQWDGPHALLRCLPEFLFGILLYQAYRRGLAARWLAGDPMLAALAAALVWTLHRGGPDLLAVPLFALLLLAAVVNRGRAAALLAATPLLWLGEISYSLYLLHGFVDFVTTQLLHDELGLRRGDALSPAWSLALLAAMIGISLLLAAASYRHVEMTARRHLRRLWNIGPAKRPVADETAAP